MRQTVFLSASRCRSTGRRHALVLAVSTALCLSLVEPVSASAPAVSETPDAAAASTAGAHQPPVPALAWTDCDGGYQCATATVPLDYDHPSGREIGIALIRLPATSTDRIGSLFVNPGGPGGSGVDFVREVGQLVPTEVRARFDVVGFDPRGVGRSTPLLCFGSQQESEAGVPPFYWPQTRAELATQRSWDRTFAAKCRQDGGPILDHMSTADVARDLDVLRRAVGDKKLTYLGYSYGSMIGQTYANLFPGKVRALVIDGVLDPISWTTGRGREARQLPLWYRVKSHVGAQATLDEFFRLCDEAGPTCAFAGHSADRFAALLDGLNSRPVGPETPFITARDVVGVTGSALYSTSSWPLLAVFLAAVEAEAGATAVGADLTALRSSLGHADVTPPVREAYDNIVESFPGVMCADSVDPTRFSAWPVAARRADRVSYFGSLWTWRSSVCLPWSKKADQDAYRGPWNKQTANPVLVIGNYFDPATPYPGAVTASKLLPNSRLLTYAGWGHTVTFQGNPCIDTAVVTYLLTTAVPAKGTVCQPVASPFAVAGPSSAAAESAVAPGSSISAAVARINVSAATPQPLRQPVRR